MYQSRRQAEKETNMNSEMSAWYYSEREAEKQKLQAQETTPEVPGWYDECGDWHNVVTEEDLAAMQHAYEADYLSHNAYLLERHPF